jgi:S-adenosyl-L-methionine hydrolase (adenosine-forming)
MKDEKKFIFQPLEIKTMNRIITLTTDFGLSDSFVGVMKGVILGINPRATIVDITHDIAAQQIEQGAFVFANSYKYFPANSIHVVVVDPGVGSARRPIAAQIGEAFFIAPDNGVLSSVLRPLSSVVHLNRPEYFLSQISHTFHGRDIFAPVAAHLSLGVPLESMGEAIADWVRLSPCAAAWRASNEIVGRVMHIDRFGNIVTNICEEMLTGLDRARVVVTLRGKSITGIKSSYSTVIQGEPLALISSSGHIEIAVRDGNAARLVGAQVGDEVVIIS